ncbi:energy transducer TonB [Noviherbaspirillum autotrophicum]|uniref:Energy transducer TonB n=1 Tax=Noviherbaspirillum autotrophicum TaxID=709839 RepID=A0A0C1Y519_9BURK|nr:energy transducer TonB [Noviherbaspirillum autotrophicum]KIF82128.1 energy transducer TonB [Noviherbaspirillum autotrophicum]
MNRTAPSPVATLATFAGQVRRIGPLGLIVLLHIGFFYALQSGLLRKAGEAFPREVIATFITPEPAREEPQPAPPKTVPVVKKAMAPPKPAPAANSAPSPKAISVDPSPPAPDAAAIVASAPELAAAPAPDAPAAPKTVTSGIEYLQPPQPEYPAISKRMGEEGKAVLRVLVNEKGRPERVELHKSSGIARLDEAARKAALRALFKPFIEDGKAVPAYAIIPINFQLD